MILYENSGIDKVLSNNDLKAGIITALENFGRIKKALIIPPDITRKLSRSGILTCAAANYLESQFYQILPATGTHKKMTETELSTFFPGLNHNNFITHNWKNGIKEIGRIPAEKIYNLTEKKLSFDWPVQVNKTITDQKWDIILSIGQVVPHEVVGFANHSKNILIGTGGEDGIHRSHYIGAICGLENIMGKIHTPVRDLLNIASEQFLCDLPIVYALTVVETEKSGKTIVRGLFIGTGIDCFYKAAELSKKVNITRVKKKFNKALVYLDPKMYRSTWLGNKAIYRTRMAMKDGGELIIAAPGINSFGEDPQIDEVIRKYGYRGTEEILKKVKDNKDLQENLCAAAHLIHGSSENRFKITYACTGLTKKEITDVGYEYMDFNELNQRYNLSTLSEGFYQDKQADEFYFINNPALGLWL